MDFGNFGNLMWFVCKFCGREDLDQRKMEWHEWHDHLKDRTQQDRSKPEPQTCFMGLPFETALKSQIPTHSGTSMLQQQQLQQQQQQQQQQLQKFGDKSQGLKLHDSSAATSSASGGTDMRNSSLSSLYSGSTDNKSISSHSNPHPSAAGASSSSSQQTLNGQLPPTVKLEFKQDSSDLQPSLSPKPTKGRTRTKGKPKAKNFECSHCQKMFSSSQNLTVHIRTHLGERPYVCRFPDKSGAKCEKAFTNQSNRDTHERIHSGIKPFKCSFCEKTFTNSSNRTMHERIHTGIRPYKCDECSSSYTSSSNLKNHKKTHFVPDWRLQSMEPTTGNQRKI